MKAAGTIRTRNRGLRAIAGALAVVLGAPAALAGSVSIPAGAGGQLAKKQPVILMDIETVDACKDPTLKLDPAAIQIARMQVEAQLPRMKRFTVYSLYNDAAGRKARQLGDTGIAAEVDESQLPAADLRLNIVATVNVERNSDKSKAEEWVVCTASITYTLTDADGKVLTDTPEASGTIRTPPPPAGAALGDMPNVRKRVFRYDPVEDQWKFKGGFEPSDPESASALVRKTVESPLKGLVAKLAIALPVTTPVTGLSPSKTQFSVRAGQRNGLFKGTKVVVWYEEGDFSYAIAEAVAEPTMEKANLRIVKWNESDPEAKDIVVQLKSGGFTDAMKDKLWATTEGIPIEEMLAP